MNSPSSRPGTGRGALPSLGDPTDSRSLSAACNAFLEWSGVHGYSPETLSSRRSHLRFFLLWCQDRALLRATEITRPLLERYQRHLYHYRKSNSEPLSLKSQTQRLLSLKVLFRWLTRQNLLLHNPASELELPRSEQRLPRHVLSAREAELVLLQPQVAHPAGLRDRAILETFYSTGMRRQELIGLRTSDIDLERGLVMIRQGKGRRDRLIPLGVRAAAWVRKYLREVRPLWLGESQQQALFLNAEGRVLRAHYLTRAVCRYVQQAALGKTGSCHLFRHTMATLMLEGGADIRYIQQMLGHADLNSTQLYTHVSVKKLQEVHARTHPAELGRTARSLERMGQGAEAEEGLPSLATGAAADEDQE